MKTLSSFCALALAVGMFSAVLAEDASAKGMHFAHPSDTTVLRLADQSRVIVAAKLIAVENTTLATPGADGAMYKRIGDGSQQDGDPNILRRAVLRVSETIKGGTDVPADNELRVVSIRQTQLGAYDSALKTGNSIYFLQKRGDGEFIIISDERGIVMPSDVGGVLLPALDFIRSYVDASSANMNARFANMRGQIMSAIRLDGTRVSVDCTVELSWNFADYESILTDADKQALIQLALSSPVSSAERPELITTLGRYKPTGAVDALFTLLYSDLNFSTSSLCAWALEMNDRINVLSRMMEEYYTVNDSQKLAIVRALGLIRPKLGYDGEGLRNGALNLIGDLLVSTTSEPLLLEALIASRDMRSGSAHVEKLKALITNRTTSGVSAKVVKGAIIALAAARVESTDAEGNNHDTVYAEDYLLDLGKNVADFKQLVTAALKTPWTTLITDAQDNGR